MLFVHRTGAELQRAQALNEALDFRETALESESNLKAQRPARNHANQGSFGATKLCLLKQVWSWLTYACLSKA